MIAVANRRPSTLKLLIEAGADIDRQIPGRLHTALTLAAEIGDLESVGILLEHDAEVNPQGGVPGSNLLDRFSPLAAAAKMYVTSVEVSQYAQIISEHGFTNRKALDFMTKDTGESNVERIRSFFVPHPPEIREAKHRIVRMLLDAGADPNPRNSVSPLAQACS